MADSKRPRAVDDRAFPFAPTELVLARDPTLQSSSGDTVERLTILAAEGNSKEAHALVAPLANEPGQRSVVAWFYLRALSGRRGARRLLRWLRQEAQRDPAERIFAPGTTAALQCWAHFRLLRHGRALTLARENIGAMEPAPKPKGTQPLAEARVWGQALEAIRCSALRRGNLRLALNFHELGEALAKKHPGSLPDAQSARQTMTAVAFLLELHREHGLPATLARYLARSLGHDDGDSPAAHAELAGDLSLRPEHLDSALGLAGRFGFEHRVAERLARLRALLFGGNWKVRRAAQRGLLVGVYVIGAVLVLLGFVLLTHLVSG